MATEKRLIDANECYEMADKCYAYFYYQVADLPILRNLLNNCPTVDAVEVVHGRCVYVRDDELTDHWECSVCGKYIPWEYHRHWNYCPNCGAKMDGDGNGS